MNIVPPGAEDAAPIWKLVEETPSLDSNAPYAYLLLCTHFSGTGLVARRAGRVLGFVLGYERPDDRATAFVWQVGVAEQARGRGLGRRLLDTWFARCARRSGVRFLEATVTASNQASRALFSSFALRLGAPCRECVAFPKAWFPEGAPHDDEIGIRIGPVPLAQAITLPHLETP